MSVQVALIKSSDSCCTVDQNRNRMWIRVLLITALSVGATQSEVIRFNRAIPGSLPAGWTVAMTHTGAPPLWEIVRDAAAANHSNVLAQLSRDKTAGRFPLAIWERALLQDGEVSVAFRAVDGSIDQAAGIVWRYQDPNNYYIVRANALENNVVLYKVEHGIRASIAPKGLPSRSYGIKHEIPAGRWNNLRVAFRGAAFTVFLNQEPLFQAEDWTFQQPGKVGLWTKADSVTYFDDFTISGQKSSVK
jgi:hypothetical protein